MNTGIIMLFSNNENEIKTKLFEILVKKTKLNSVL